MTRKKTDENTQTTPEVVEKKPRGRKKKMDDGVSTEKDPKTMTVTEYFDYVKGLKKTTDSEHVKKMAEVCEKLMKKFIMLGQTSAAERAKHAFETLKRDIELCELGFNTYINIDDVSKYINTVSGKNVKIIELQHFPREIPDDVVEKWLNVKDKFDKAYIVFTDYTSETEETDTVAAAEGKMSTIKEVEKRRKEKDPILFGALRVDSSNSSMKNNTYEKLFYIADWIDDYCDLTFDKLIDRMAKENINPIKNVEEVKTAEDFKRIAGL